MFTFIVKTREDHYWANMKFFIFKNQLRFVARKFTICKGRFCRGLGKHHAEADSKDSQQTSEL
jgi:hypothetical protein